MTQPNPAQEFPFAVRVRAVSADEAKVYARSQAFGVGPQASLRESDAQPSAVELLLGALGGDLVRGMQVEAQRRGIAIDAMELSLTGRLANPLVQLGVVGETGHPGFETIRGTLFVSADTDEATLETMWQSALARAPVYATLGRACTLAIDVRLAP